MSSTNTMTLTGLLWVIAIWFLAMAMEASRIHDEEQARHHSADSASVIPSDSPERTYKDLRSRARARKSSQEKRPIQRAQWSKKARKAPRD